LQLQLTEGTLDGCGDWMGTCDAGIAWGQICDVECGWGLIFVHMSLSGLDNI